MQTLAVNTTHTSIFHIKSTAMATNRKAKLQATHLEEDFVRYLNTSMEHHYKKCVHQLIEGAVKYLHCDESFHKIKGKLIDVLQNEVQTWRMCRKRKILQSNGSRQQTRKKSKIKPKDDRVREKVNSKLRDYVKLFGPEWALISQLLNLDFQKQLNLELDRKNLCQYYHRTMDSSVQRSSLSADESETLLRFVRAHGRKWREISKYLQILDWKCRYEHDHLIASMKRPWSGQEDTLLVMAILKHSEENNDRDCAAIIHMLELLSQSENREVHLLTREMATEINFIHENFPFIDWGVIEDSLVALKKRRKFKRYAYECRERTKQLISRWKQSGQLK